MRNKSVAVLDIRSSEITAVIAEKGVNNTFIIKSKYTRPYEGFAEGEIIDLDDFTAAVVEAVENIVLSGESPIRKLFVGVPGEFVEAVQTDKVMSFQFAQRVSSRHLNTIRANSQPATADGFSVIRHGALYYVLSDKRKMLNPLGTVTDSLRARACFFTCKTSFMDTVKRVLRKYPSITEYEWLPQDYTQGQYLFEPEQRDGYSVLFDLGFISSTFSVVCGGGIAFSEAFSIGIGHVAVLLMEALDIPYEVALAVMKKVSLNVKDGASSRIEHSEGGIRYTFESSQLRELIREALDGLCAMIETCLQSFTRKDLTGAPIAITGEGVGVIRGTIEHFSSRLVTPMEVVAPKLPYYDKPQFSSLFSLLYAALGGIEAQ